MLEGRIEKDYFLFHLNKEGTPEAEKEVLEYGKAGDFETTETIEFRCPGMSEFKEASTLSQLVMGAMMDAAKRSPDRTEDKEDAEIDAAAVKIILFTSQDISFVDVAECFKFLAVKVGTCDGEVKLTYDLLKKLGYETYIRMICEYIANFILPSLISEMGEG